MKLLRPNTRVQRTRLRSPLTRHPLGGGKAWWGAGLLLVMSSCGPSSETPRLIKVTVENQSDQLLEHVELISISVGGRDMGGRKLGRLLPGSSVESLIDTDEPRTVDVQVWGGHCPARESSPILVPGADYKAVVTVEATPNSVTTDYECHQHFKITGSLRWGAAA